MRDPASWVGLLSCGHTIGSVFRPVDPEVLLTEAKSPYQRQQEAMQAAFGGVTTDARALPAAPKWVPAPPERAIVWCHEETCGGEPRYVISVIENRDEMAPNLDEKRARRYATAGPAAASPAEVQDPRGSPSGQ